VNAVISLLFAVHADLGEHGAGVLVDHRQQVFAGYVTVGGGVSGSAQGLTVDGQHPAPPGRGAGGAQPLHEPSDHCVEQVGVDSAQQPADRRFRRAPLIHPERGGHLCGQVSDPLGDGDERPGACGDRAHHAGQHTDQPMADATALAWIGHPGQRRAQVRRHCDRIG